jgi:RNA polymerase sigma-70 factor, ECF subfamily
LPPPSDARTDLELVAALNAGDVSAFDALYYRYRDWVVRLAARFAGHEDDALDVLQETFAYVLRKFPGFQLTASMTTFLYPVVKHLALAARRKRLRMAGEETLRNAAPSGNDPEPFGPRAELAAVLAGLPDAHREVLLMRFVDGLALEEISVALDIPLGTVKSRIHNAIAALRKDPRVRNYFEPG